MIDPNEIQVTPSKNNWPELWDLVISEVSQIRSSLDPVAHEQYDFVLKDMRDRNELGKYKYGVALQPFNGRNSTIDAYQEALDCLVYLRQILFELDNSSPDRVGQHARQDYRDTIYSCYKTTFTTILHLRYCLMTYQSIVEENHE